MHKAFISYSSKEMEMAETVRKVLERNGISCWMAPRDIPGGSNYSKEIPAAIRACQVFVLILSQNAQQSPWVLRELDMAVNCGKVILPFMLEDCSLNDEFNFLLTGAQRYAAYQKKADAMKNLVARIHGVTDGEHDVFSEKEEKWAPEEITASMPNSEKTVMDVLLENSRCPACGSDQLIPLKNIGKYIRKEEWIYNLSSIPICILAGLVGICLGVEVDSMMLWLLIWVLGTVFGTKLFRRVTDKKVYRLRIRSHVKPYPYRCEKCDWICLFNEDGSAVKGKKK